MKNEIYNDDSARNLPDLDGYSYCYYKSFFLELQKAYTSLENDYIQLEEKYYHYQNKIYSSQTENEEPKKILGTKKSKDTLEINLENQAINPKINQLNDMILNDTNKAEVIAEKNKRIITNLEEEIKRLKETIESNQKIMNEKDYKIESLENQINSYNQSQSKQISELNEKNKELLNQLQKEKDEKEKLISEKEKIDSYNKTLENQITKIKQKLQIKEKLEKDYNELLLENENLKNNLKSNPEKINELENILKEKEKINNLNEKELFVEKKLNDEKENGLNFNNKEDEIKDVLKNNDNMFDKINNLNNDDGKEYSYNCTNSMFLAFYIYKGTDEAYIKIHLKNNGNETWANDSKLLVDSNSKFKADEITLDPQKPNEEKIYNVKLKDLKNYPIGEYKAFFVFYSGGKIHGEKIVAIIKIKEIDDANKEINENIDKIKEFRETFNLDEGELSDEKLLEALKEKDFNYDDAFNSLFQ